MKGEAPLMDMRAESAMRDVREKFIAGLRQRIEFLESVAVCSVEERLNEAVRRQAWREAHQLAGTLETFGLAPGTRFAREMEELLQGEMELSPAQSLRLSQLTVALRLLAAREADEQTPARETVPPAFNFLLYSADEDLHGRLAIEAAAAGAALHFTCDPGSAKSLMATGRIAGALIDLEASDSRETGLRLLKDLSGLARSVPVCVLTRRDSFTDRVEVAACGGKGFIPAALPAGEIIDVLAGIARRCRPDASRVLVVDDDAAILGVVTSILASCDIQTLTLSSPLQFWDALELHRPDLVMLDVDMPDVNGIDLCQVMRNEPRWAQVPVLFLTHITDKSTIQRLFASGADDYVAKPIVGPELVTRIQNRLERSRMLRDLRDTDLLTGVWSRRRATAVLNDLAALSLRLGQPLSLAFLDVDSLAEINREYGHGSGDRVLQSLASLLQKHFHSQDVVGRWCGEQFVVGMAGMSRYDGVQRIADVLAEFRETPVTGLAESGRVITFSAGIAQFPEDAGSLEALVPAAVEALSRARESGGNKVLPFGWKPASSSTLTSLDVVLVTGDELQSVLLQDELERRGYRIRVFPNANAAESLLAGSHPALTAKVALLDVDTPGRDGIALLRRLAWDGILRKTRAIVITSPTVRNDVAEAIEAGAFDYIARPFGVPVVINHIRRAMEG